MSKTWLDTTSYQRDETRVPAEWSIDLNGLRVVVHRHVHYPAPTWLLSDRAGFFHREELKSPDAEDAKREALVLIKARLLNILEALP